MPKRPASNKPTSKPAEHDDVGELQAKIEELTADLQRIQADYVNFRQRAEIDKQQSIRFGRETAVMALLGAIDNVERALGHLPQRLAKDEWALGVRAVAKQLDDSLRGIGVERFESVGQEFNPELHEAISVEEGKGNKEVVVAELQPGYAMDGEVIRHAIVKVGRK